jgi:hypothetical protein
MIKYIFTRIKSVFAIFSRFGKADTKAIEMGTAAYSLIQRKSMQYQHNGKITRVQSLISSRWVKRKGKVYSFPQKEPNPHIIIVGMSGFGKSTLFKSIMINVHKIDIPIIVFDSHNEHEEVVNALNGMVYNSRYTGINIFDLNGSAISERISELTSLFRNVYSLGYIQATKLSECMWYMYRKNGARSKNDRSIKNTPTPKDLIAELSIFIKNARTSSEKNTLVHLKERMSLINTSAFNTNFVEIRRLQDGISSFSLASLGSGEIQLIYVHELLKRLYTSMKSNKKERGLSIYIMLDEAQFLIGSTKNESSIIRKMVEEGRKYGVGIIIATHITSNLDTQITANASTFISFYSREPSEINYISNALSGGDPERKDAIRKKLRELKQNEAIMISGLIKNPMIIYTPKITSILDFLSSRKNMSIQKDDRNIIVEQAVQPIKYEELLEKFPEENINGLVDEGVIDKIAEHNVDGSNQTWIMKHKNSLSIEHEVCVKRIADKLEDQKIKSYILDNSRGPDLVAYIDGKKIAIEYETGSKRYESTAKMLNARKKGYFKTLIFTNSAVTKFYKDYFAEDKVQVLDIKELSNHDFSFIN